MNKISDVDIKDIQDLLETIEGLCKIAYILMNLQHDDLLPLILDDITFFAQELQDYLLEMR